MVYQPRLWWFNGFFCNKRPHPPPLQAGPGNAMSMPVIGACLCSVLLGSDLRASWANLYSSVDVSGLDPSRHQISDNDDGSEASDTN